MAIWAVEDRDRAGRCTYEECRLDVQQTAIATYNKFINAGRPSPPDFKPYHATKGDIHEYNDCIRKLNQKVVDTYKVYKPNANVHLWDDFDGTMDQINIARAGDYGPYLVDAARASPRLNGMTVHMQKLGNNPVTGAAWETVNWAETANRARADAVTDAQTKIRGF